MVIGDVRP
jgi:hypothetical protein